MLYRKFFVLMSTLTVSLSTFAGVKVANIDMAVKGNNGIINVAIEGRSNELPDVKVNGKTIEVTLNKADAFNAITKNVQGTELSANSIGGKVVIRAVLPYAVSPESVNLGWKNNNIEVVFPRGKVIKVTAPEQGISPKEIVPPKAEVVPSKISKDSLNEDYLNGLMKENNAPKEVAKIEKVDEINIKQAAPVTVTQPAHKPASSDSFSFAGYAAKFTVFLALVLGLFYGIVQLLKKGVFTRGKLGFLNNAQMIEVLSTTYVAPKRSLMVIRAHKQIFLVSNSESGLALLSEMKDTTGLIKDGEKFVTGTNFDENLTNADATGFDAFVLKEDIMESAPFPAESGLAKLAAAKDDIVKFSDELKKKAKKLKPIEGRVN